MISIQKKRSKKPFVIASGAVIVLLVGYGAAAALLHLPPFVEKKTTYAKPGQQKIDLSKSETEKKSIQSLQDNPSTKTTNSQTDTPKSPTDTTSDGKTEVNVLLTNTGITNGSVSASGFVTNAVESGGQCTYIFTNGAVTLKKQSTTTTNPTSTTCQTVRFDADELTVNGTWKVVLLYSSTTSEGTSNSQEFTK